MTHAFLAATDRQQAPVGGQVPMPGEARLGKGPVEGEAMALELRFRQGAIHIPEQGSGQAIGAGSGHPGRLKPEHDCTRSNRSNRVLPDTPGNGHAHGQAGRCGAE